MNNGFWWIYPVFFFISGLLLSLIFIKGKKYIRNVLLYSIIVVPLFGSKNILIASKYYNSSSSESEENEEPPTNNGERQGKPP